MCLLVLFLFCWLKNNQISLPTATKTTKNCWCFDWIPWDWEIDIFTVLSFSIHEQDIFFLFYFFSYWFEKKRKGETQTDRDGDRDSERKIVVREKHLLVAFCMCPSQVGTPQPRSAPWLGMEPATLSAYRVALQPTELPDQSKNLDFL